MYMIYLVTGYLWGLIPIIGDVNLLGMIVAPWFHIYFDIFGAMVQAYVFALLTGIYWSQEVEKGEIIMLEKKEKQERKIVAQQVQV